MELREKGIGFDYRVIEDSVLTGLITCKDTIHTKHVSIRDNCLENNELENSLYRWEDAAKTSVTASAPNSFTDTKKK